MLTMCSAGRQAGRHAHSVTHTLLSSGGSGFLWSSLDFCFFDSPLQRPGWGRLNSIWCVCGCGRVCVWVNFVYSLSISLSCSKSFFFRSIAFSLSLSSYIFQKMIGNYTFFHFCFIWDTDQPIFKNMYAEIYKMCQWGATSARNNNKQAEDGGK